MKSARKAKVAVAPLNHYSPIRNVCLSLQDQSTLYRSAVDFFDIKGMRDPTAPAAILAERFITHNRPVAALLDLNIQQAFDGREVKIIIRSGNTVGAIPLISPTSARFDYCARSAAAIPLVGARIYARGNGLARSSFTTETATLE